jgi:hypothetical protein
MVTGQLQNKNYVFNTSFLVLSKLQNYPRTEGYVNGKSKKG